METIISNLDFNGCLIQLTQSDGFDTMINATEMWKSLGGGVKNKQPYEWLRLPSTVEYLEALKSEPGISRFTSSNSTPRNLLDCMGLRITLCNSLEDIGYCQESEPGKNHFTPVITIKGHYSDGTRPGTWMHRWVAIRYAQWLDPRFAVWVDSKIDELLRTGFTTALQEERDRYNALLPQVNYYNEVLTYSENLYSTEQLCKDLGLDYGTKILLKKLEEKKYIYRRPGTKGWYLSSPYDKEGYTKVTSVVVTDKNGNKFVKNKKRWTETGKHWIWSLSKKL